MKKKQIIKNNKNSYKDFVKKNISLTPYDKALLNYIIHTVKG